MPSSLSGDKHAAVSAEAQEVDALGVSEQVGLGSIARVVHRHDGVDGVRDPASVGRPVTKQKFSMGKQLENKINSPRGCTRKLSGETDYPTQHQRGCHVSTQRLRRWKVDGVRHARELVHVAVRAGDGPARRS